MKHSLRARSWGWGLLVALALATGGGARAGAEETPVAEQLKRYHSKELENLAKIVSLTDEQCEAATTLYIEWQRRTSLANQKINAFYGALNSERYYSLPNRTELFHDASRKSQQHRDKLRAQLNADFQILLSESQMEKWPLFERDLRRQTWLSQASQFTGAGVDLVGAMDTAAKDTEWNEEVAALLEEYKSAIDPAVRELEQRYRAAMEVYWSRSDSRSQREDDISPEELALAAAGRSAQRVNLRYAREMLGILDEHHQVMIEKRLFARPSYRTISWNSRQLLPETVMQSALRAPDLSEDHRAALQESIKEFDERLRYFRSRLFHACVAVEAEMPNEEFGRRSRTRENDPRIEEVLKSGDAIVAGFVAVAKLILTEEQVQSLGPPFINLELLELNLDDED